MSEPAGAWRAAWVAALAALEAEIDQIEGLLTDDHRVRDLPVPDPWSPPPGLGPLPLDLRPRADEVLARQLAAARAITRTLVANRRQAHLTLRMESGARAATRPAYVDRVL
jgi:hypothetical protein